MRDDYFAENMGSNIHTTKQQPKKWVSIATLIISIIAVAILTLIVSAKWDNVLQWLWIQEQTDDEVSDVNFSIWDDVELSGIIVSDGDMTNYTHTINTEFWLIWLKSSKINLNNYSKEVSLEWFVEKFYQWIPVVSVSSIYEIDFDDEMDENTWNIQKKYLPKLWLYFDENFFEKYSLINEWNWSSIKIKELESNQIIQLQYFKCDSNSLNENCDKLVQNIWWQASQNFVDSYGNKYYKQSWLESWFFTNWTYWYFINELQDSYVKDLSKYIVLVNQKFVEKQVSKNVSKLCVKWDYFLKSISKSELKFQNSKFVYYVDWNNWSEAEISCQLEFDPILSDSAKLLNIEVKWEVSEDSKNDTEEKVDSDWWQNVTNWDPNVAQFPINLEKKMTFTSSRWHSFVFPSSNLSYKWFDADEDFDQAGVRCYSAMHVVAYTNSWALETDPSVIVYECSMKKWFDDSAQNIIYRQAWDRNFVIKIVDPAWVNFANNIEIQA